MKVITVCGVVWLSLVLGVASDGYINVTKMYQPEVRQLYEYRQEHPHSPLATTSAGSPIDIRDILTINSDVSTIASYMDVMLHFTAERIPARLVNAKGTGAFGYFEVTNDVSKYTYADVFDGIGKKTPIVARFSTALQGPGGADTVREFKGLAVKFYTQQGNLDILCLNSPVFLDRDPLQLPSIVHALKDNPKTGMPDQTALWDLVVLRPSMVHSIFWLFSDYGLPDGYRKMDAFAIHTFELGNKHGETHYARFSFRTEQGFEPLSSAKAAEIQSTDLNYFTRDLYRNIADKNYPSWRLEMDVMTKHDIQNVDYDPFDVTRLWKNGTFKRVPIGRIVLNQNVDNQFRDVEQLAFNPSNLVPGIPDIPDDLYKARAMVYKVTQNYRLGVNHNKISINMPLYAKNYNIDGAPPVKSNEEDAPNYFPNSFNGPTAYIDEKKSKSRLRTLESNAVDLEPSWYFYNYIIKDEAHRNRFIETVSTSLASVTPPVLEKVLKLLYLIDHDLGHRVSVQSDSIRKNAAAQREAAAPKPNENPVNVETVQARRHEY